MTDMIKVIIADDHAILTKGIKMFVEQTDDIEVIAEAKDGEDKKAAEEKK